MAEQRRIDRIGRPLILIAAMLTIALWAYIYGTVSTLVQENDSLQSIHRSYNHIRIYEDGSYTGQTVGGDQVTGCIKKALCSKGEGNE